MGGSSAAMKVAKRKNWKSTGRAAYSARYHEVLALEAMPGRVHVFLSAPPKEAPAAIAKVLKGATARTLFTRHPELRKWLRGHLWNSRSYHVAAAGKVSAETVRRYIEAQRVAETDLARRAEEYIEAYRAAKAQGKEAW
jgi:REP element-mobilizing transposase RayT